MNATFNALPKNSYGRLSTSSVRYILHRQLLRGRAWHVKGIDPEGQEWDIDSPASAFQDIAPDGLRSLFHHPLSSRGFGLRETALMLGAIEVLIQKDALLRITNAYHADGLKIEDNVTYSQYRQALETFLRSVVLGPRNAWAMTPRVVNKLRTYNMTEMYPGWPRTLDWVATVEQHWLQYETKPVMTSKEARYPFKDVANMVNHISQHYGTWQNGECRMMKKVLLKLEDPDCPGRVTLARFWDSALTGGMWQFTENMEYLRSNGVLDETDPQYPSIIVPNYMTSFTNCVASSGFFTTCCADECEPVMGRLEAELRQPAATPTEIAAAVARIETLHQPARESLPSFLMQQLESIAELHGGFVPLHGRLFAQWLHHAFPRDCNYPAIANTRLRCTTSIGNRRQAALRRRAGMK